MDDQRSSGRADFRGVDPYDDLMARRAALFKEWMRYVDAWKDEGYTVRDRFTPGVVLGDDGSLRITAFDRRRRYVLELSSLPFTDEIVLTLPEKLYGEVEKV